MKLARFSVEGSSRIGLVEDDSVVDLQARLPDLPDDMMALIAAWSHFFEAVKSMPRTADYRLSDVHLLAPIPRPGKILGIGLNYSDHIAEAGMDPPKHQVWFSKPATAVNGPYDAIELPIVSEQLDYEGELVFIVGRRCRHVSIEKAQDAIFGYCVGNDVSVRDWQLRTGQFMIGKCFDTHAPFGPWIVTSDEIDSSNLAIRCSVNAEKRQQSNTRHLIFDCAAQLSHLSQAMTMEPGDVIYTGTPGGVGLAMEPPQFLRAGDKVLVEIDGIGHLENTVVKEIPWEGAWT